MKERQFSTGKVKNQETYPSRKEKIYKQVNIEGNREGVLKARIPELNSPIHTTTPVMIKNDKYKCTFYTQYTNLVFTYF